MEDLTKKEIKKLAESIRTNPEILKNDESSESELELDSSSESDSSSYRNSSVELYKKAKKIEKLEEKQYYKALEINNLNLENIELKDKIAEYETTQKIHKFMFETIVKIICLKNIDKIDTIEVYKGDNLKLISSKMIQLEENYQQVIKNANKLKEDINIFNYADNIELIRTYYKNLISDFLTNYEKKYTKKREYIESCFNTVNNKNNYFLNFLLIVFMAYIYSLYYKN